MSTRDILLILTVLSVQAIFVCAGPPDWMPPEMLDMVQGDKERCMSEHGTTQAQIDQVNDGVLVNERPISCYMYCLLEAFSLADEDGVLDADMLLSFLPEDLQAKGASILNDCATQDGGDNCDKIFKVAQCVQSAVPELWFMV